MFTLPACKPAKTGNKSLLSSLGLDAFVLFKKERKWLFSSCFPCFWEQRYRLPIRMVTFSWVVLPVFEYADSFGVKHSVILLSISQMSETLFILAIPFFLRHFGIKQVMLISMFAWVFRFGLFGFGDPGSGLWMLIPIHDRLWHGIRFLQHFGFVVC